MQGNLCSKVPALLHLLPRRLGCEGSLELGTLGSGPMLAILSSSSSCSSSASSAKSSSWNKQTVHTVKVGQLVGWVFAEITLTQHHNFNKTWKTEINWGFLTEKEAKFIYLIKCITSWSRDGITDFSGQVLLLCYILHHVINLVNVSKRAKERTDRKNQNINTGRRSGLLLIVLRCWVNADMVLCTFSKALEA